MSNNGPKILELQNSDTNIQMLAAQKELYSTAKQLFVYQCIIAGPLAILVSVFSILFKEAVDKVAWMFALYTIFALIAEVILEEIISSLKKKAASIQDLFDNSVLGIEWNSTLIPKKPEYEQIHKYYKKHVKANKLDTLYNWYSIAINEVTTNLATIISQRTNCTYDFALRKWYRKTIIGATILVFLFLFIISASAGISMQSFIVEILAPSAPIFLLAWKQISANNEAIQNLSSLRDLIEAVLSNSNINTVVDEKTIRQIQDKIYYNRVLSPLLPDWIFRKRRASLEEGMNFSVTQQVNLLKAR